MISKRYYLTVLTIVPILVTQVFLAGYYLKKARSSVRLMRIWRTVVASFSVVILLSMLSEFMRPPRGLRDAATIAQTVVNLYGLVSVAAVAILVAIHFVTNRLPDRFQQERRQALRILAGAGVAVPVIAAGFGVFVERTNFEICETAIRFRSLPRDLHGLRLLQISDIHLGPYLSERTLAKVIDAANELKAHMAFVTGDLITAKGDPLDACLAQLARLKSEAKTLACLGNHEIYAGAIDHAVAQGARLGIEFLRNQTRTMQIGSATLNVAGVDYEPFDLRPKYLPKAGSLVEEGALNVLLSHNPDVFPVAAAQGFDLTLGGHMHGGQVTFEFLNPALNPARILTPYVRGLYRLGERACYVTRGIGTLGVPVRLGARPEITLLTLEQA